MGYLDQFKKDATNMEETTHIGGRVAVSIVNAFKEHCADLNLTVSEGLRLLMEKELRENQRDITPAEQTKELAAKIAAENPLAGRRTPYSMGRTKIGELSYFMRKIDSGKYMPCPICQNWSGYGPYSKRHTRKHGFTTSIDFLTDEQHREAVEDMLRRFDNGEPPNFKKVEPEKAK